MLIAHARVSTTDQKFDLQLDALFRAGCENRYIFTDKISGVRSDRPGLTQALNTARAGDTLVVWRLDRIGRSLKHIVEIVIDLKEAKVGFHSLTENIDTTSPTGMLVFNIFASLADFERKLIRERTLAGLKAARAWGRKGNRRSTMGPKKIQLAAKLIQQKDVPIKDVYRMVGCSLATLYRYVGPDGAVRKLPGKYFTYAEVGQEPSDA